MAKGGNKLMKLKSVLKKLNSFNTKPNQPPASANQSRSSAVSAFPSEDLQTVYVGRTRRPYHVSSDVVSHPLFQQLAAVDGGYGGEEGSISVSCEVVLFEHLLWMLENGDADESRPESVHELVEFYAC
ncbi:Auxin-responsive protein SAUR76 [Cardamine amara subsp. amara]|uniref:Auxin-responsive protein SAUR76 n=1 Tax=Cardamine amara subsp. amara TaxID=228776 RepID=A0ABD0ZR34_CARAN